jgi:dTMP kinase
VLDPALGNLSVRAEVLLMLAARAQHAAEVIVPALDAGQDVVCDRFSGSTVAYQGYGRGLDPEELVRLSDWAAEGLRPDRIVLLHVTPEVAWSRRRARGGEDRLEGEGAEFFERVERGFAELAAADPARWRVVDGSGSEQEVAVRVRHAAGFPK